MIEKREYTSRAGQGQPTLSWRGFVALLLALAMLAAACGSSSSDGETADDAPADSSESADEPADDAPADEPADDAPADDAPADDEPADDEPADDEPADDAPADDAPADEPAMDATGEPILVMVSGTIESPVFAFPSVPVGAQVAIDEVNAAGGVNGRPLELVVCNDEMNPSNATACVQQAVQDGVVSLIGGLTLFEPALTPLMEQESLPWTGSSSVTQTSSPVIFTGSSGVVPFAGMGIAAVQDGCTNPALVISAQATPTNLPHMTAGVVSAGGEVVADFQAAGPDFAPIVESILASGAGCIVAGVAPPEIPGLLAANAGRLQIYTIDGSIPQGMLDGLGAAANGIKVVSGFLLPGSGDANVLALQETSQALNPAAPMDQFWFSSYIGVKSVAAALEGAPEISSAAVLEGLSSVTIDTGVGPVIDYTTPNPVPAYSQVFYTGVYLWELQDGQYTLAQDELIDAQPAIELLGQG